MTAEWKSVSGATATLGNDPVVTRPLGTVDGNLMIGFAIATAGHTIALSGKTPDPASLGPNGRLWIWEASSEPADYTFVVTGGSGNCLAVVLRVDKQHPDSPIDDISGITGTGDMTLDSIDSLGADRLLLAIFGKNSNTSFTISGGSILELWDETAAPNSFTHAGAGETVGPGATGTRTGDVLTVSTTPGIGFLIAIAPNVQEIDGDIDFTFSSVGEINVDSALDEEAEFAFSAVGDIIVESALDISGVRVITFGATAELEVSGGGEGSVSDIARFRAAFFLGYSEPELSGIDTSTLLREYWATKAGIVGDLSTYSVSDIISEHFPGSHFIRDVE